MKSAAFNLAFKVHRNELPFAEGILKSNEEGAAEDFLDALNSLAGEMRYDPAQLPSLLQQAQGDAGGDVAPLTPAIDVLALQEEIGNLRKRKEDFEEGINTLKTLLARHEPVMVPGINSVMLLIACGVFVALLFVFNQPIIGAVLILIGLSGAGVMYMKDLRTMREQQAEVDRRRAKNEAEIKQLQGQLAETQKALAEKEAKLQSVQREHPSSPEPL
ncbi:MAG: hypothetical protein ABIH23_25045 [bacterium]